MGRILFLSAVAYLAYRYISRSNQKTARQISQKEGTVEILPPVEQTPSIPAPSAVEYLPGSKQVARLSGAVEGEPGRRQR